MMINEVTLGCWTVGWTEDAVWRCDFMFWEVVMRNVHSFLDKMLDVSNESPPSRSEGRKVTDCHFCSWLTVSNISPFQHSDPLFLMVSVRNDLPRHLCKRFTYSYRKHHDYYSHSYWRYCLSMKVYIHHGINTNIKKHCGWPRLPTSTSLNRILTKAADCRWQTQDNMTGTVPQATVSKLTT